MKITKEKPKERQQQQVQEVEVCKKPKTPPYFQIKEYPPDGICQRLSFMLIRPPRFTYNPQMLKPNVRNSKRFKIETFDIGFDLTLYKQQSMKYVVLYLHGNGSSRYEASLFLHQIPDNIGVACFDFSGCGNRYESEYITLGQNQCKDVDTAARYLKSKGYKVVGWGRSMGGASLLKSNEIDIMVSDSAYSNLSQLCKESASKFLPPACCCIFHLFFPCVFACLKCKIQSTSGLRVGEMDVVGHLKKISSKAHRKQICFIHGKNDTLVPPDNAQKLYDSFNGHKKIIIFDGNHNSTRPDQIINQCFQFIEQRLRANEGRLPENLKLDKMIELKSIQIPKEYERMPSPDTSPTTLKHSVSSKTIKINQKNNTYANLNSQNTSSFPITQGIESSIKDDEFYQQGVEIELILRDKPKPQEQINTFASNFKSGSQPNILNKQIVEQKRKVPSKKKSAKKSKKTEY